MVSIPQFNQQRIAEYLFKQVDASSLVVFRVCFGVIMMVDVWRYVSHDWIERYFIVPNFLFKYYGFEWVEPWSGDGMYWHFALLGLLSLMITIGAFYRFASILFFFAFTYFFLLEQARYLNHFYLVIIFSFLLMLVPVNRKFAVDALIWPKSKSNTVPMWSVWLIRVQLEIILLYAGIVKINADWLRLEPLGMWLSRNDHWAFIGPYFNQDWVVAMAAYGVILLHVVGAPLLFFKRTRIAVMCVYFSFHLMNHFLFNIGIFPWFTIAATFIFLDPNWPKQLIQKVSNLFEPLLQRNVRIADG